MLQSHVAPGLFTGTVRTKIKESRRGRADPHDFFEEFWTRTGAV